MKILQTTRNFSVFEQSNILQKQKNNPIEQNKNTMELTNFNSIGRSLISFKGDDDKFDLAEKTIQELEELKKLYLANQDEIDKKKKAAQANLTKITAWDRTNEYNKQLLEAENEIDRENLSRFWNPFKCKAIREKHFNAFHAKDVEINRLKTRKDVDLIIIASSPLSSTQVQLLVSQIDAMIAQKIQLEKQRIRLEGIDGVQKTINSMFNKEGGLNDRIAGYEYEKDEITKMFVEPLAKSKDNSKVKVPAAVLLHGATGTGKTTFLNGIGEQASDYAKVIDLSPDVEAEDFPREIRNQMKDARARYFEVGADNKIKKTRTILLINEAERFLSMTPDEAKTLLGGDFMDPVDIEYMEQYGHTAKYVNNFKTLLDTCSEVPKDINDTNRGALTIFMTSNYPHLIHPDLLSRDGKMPFLAINPARNENISAVVKHYFKKAFEATEKIKLITDPDDVNHLIGISRTSKEKIKELMKKGEIDKLNIDYENFPYDKIAAEFNPSTKKGAFSNDAYRKIAAKAYDLYLADPSHSFGYYFSDVLIKEDSPVKDKITNIIIKPSNRDIQPNRYKKFISIYNMLAPADVEEKTILLRQEKLGTLDEKAKARLAYIRMKEASELKNLEEKESENILSDEEKARLQELRNPENITNDSDDEEE